MSFSTGISRAWQRISKSLFQTGDSTIEVYNGVKPQALYVYNKRLDASNYERGICRWSANVFEIGQEVGGSGTARDVQVLFEGASLKFRWRNDRILSMANDGTHWTFGPSNSVEMRLFAGSGVVIGSTASLNGDNGIRFGSSGDVFVGRDAALNITCNSRSNDTAAKSITITSGPAYATASTNITGGNLSLTGGAGASSSSGAANGGSVVIAGGAGYGTGTKGIVTASRLRADGFATATAAKTADYTATLDDGTIEVDASGAARTITLFAASGNAGKILVIKKTDSSANAVTVDGNASETIDGATTVSLASQYSTAILQVNAAGTGWNKLAGV